MTCIKPISPSLPIFHGLKYGFFVNDAPDEVGIDAIDRGLAGDQGVRSDGSSNGLKA
jgi:hypothetical protein